jgi:peptidoglycan/xylan/chitin deacetylase (PgdA/CDA1 family)
MFIDKYLNERASKHHGLILLYHSVSPAEDLKLNNNIHNVTPSIFEKQILWLKTHYKTVSLEEWLRLSDVSGYAAVTFDDAYRSVFKHAAPILLKNEVPFTIFINGKTLSGGAFWRDKVRYIIHHNYTDRFCSYYMGKTGLKIDPCNFYRASKHPTLNSAELDHYLDEFIEAEKLAHSLIKTGDIARAGDLLHSPFIHYGNHSFHHYVLSSLDEKQQAQEVIENKTFLAQLNIPQTTVFSLPFGGEKDINDVTRNILFQEGYSHILFSRNRVNTGSPAQDIERFMPPDSMSLFHRKLRTARKKTPL